MAAMFDTDRWVKAWVKMWNSYDLREVDRLFLTDGRLTYFSSEKEGVIRGIDAVREHHHGFGFVEGGVRRGNRLWVEDLEVRDYGAAVVAGGVWFFQRKGTDAKDAQRGPVTFVYVPQGDEYRLAHLHFANY
jgi:hypothetical protein